MLTGSCTTSGRGSFGRGRRRPWLVGWLVFVVPICQLPKGWLEGVQENGMVIYIMCKNFFVVVS